MRDLDKELEEMRKDLDEIQENNREIQNVLSKMCSMVHDLWANQEYTDILEEDFDK